MEVYQVLFNEKEDTGVYALSVVEEPAMDGLFLALKKEEIKLAEVDKEQRLLMGLALEPDKPIYRNQDGKEFYIVFPKETIKAAAHSFLKNGFQKNSSIEHKDPIQGVSVVESWIIEDEEKDKSRAYGFNYPVGSWMATMKVDNDELWNDYVKTGRVKGFSIDGLFSMKQLNMNKMDKSIIEVLKDEFKNFIAEFKGVKKVELAKAKLADGTEVAYEGDMPEVGKSLFVVAEDGTEVPAPDGDLTLEDGKVISVKDGAISDIKEKAVEMEDENIMEKIKELFATMSSDFKKEVQLIKSQFAKDIAEKDGEIQKLTAELEKTPAAAPVKKTDVQGVEKPTNKKERLINTLRKIS